MNEQPEQQQQKQSMVQPSFLDRLTDKIEESVGVKAVFGAPVERDGTTVIPVAKARWGLGGGSGVRAGSEGKGTQSGTGGGGGGMVSPVGFIELSEGCARFRTISSNPLMAIGGVLLGLSVIRTFFGAMRMMRPGRRMFPFGMMMRKRGLFA